MIQPEIPDSAKARFMDHRIHIIGSDVVLKINLRGKGAGVDLIHPRPNKL